MIGSRWNGVLRRLFATLVLVGFLPLATTACFGKFQLTRKVYEFNKDVSPDKWIQWLVFLVITIVPIYGIAVFVDAIIANSLEFWTGKNPVSAGTQRTLTGPNGEVLSMQLMPDDSIAVSIQHGDAPAQKLRLTRDSNGISAFDAQGELVAHMGIATGLP